LTLLRTLFSSPWIRFSFPGRPLFFFATISDSPGLYFRSRPFRAFFPKVYLLFRNGRQYYTSLSWLLELFFFPGRAVERVSFLTFWEGSTVSIVLGSRAKRLFSIFLRDVWLRGDTWTQALLSRGSPSLFFFLDVRRRRGGRARVHPVYLIGSYAPFFFRPEGRLLRDRTRTLWKCFSGRRPFPSHCGCTSPPFLGFGGACLDSAPPQLSTPSLFLCPVVRWVAATGGSFPGVQRRFLIRSCGVWLL